MGIYDREYYRDETRGSGFFSGAAPACKAIIFLNVVVFVASNLFVGTDNFLLKNLSATSESIFKHYQVYRLLTATFLHAGIMHLAFNMLALWWAGRDMEAMYGTREFAFMYCTAAVFSTLCWAIGHSMGPAEAGDVPMIGASGAVMAVVVLYALYYPHRELYFWGILRVEIWMLLVIYIAADLFSLLQQFQGGLFAGVAFGSHLGGALYGYLYKAYDLRWTRLLASRRQRPRLRVVSPEPRDKVSPLSSASQSRSVATSGARTAAPFSFPEEQLDARLDEVLAKIAREGPSGLTEEEQRILQEASQRARDKRGERIR
ncbi:MAG TPA: rhomboid family intramembrane serine protease [Isosphaeraceae bacterium]|jgi:membrane associated rhomboid family serine protease|nr:rhomboid family intramembrane serine protease [Isosphaeraceae bacterium]